MIFSARWNKAHSGTHFMNDFSIEILIWWKICRSITPLCSILSLHITTSHCICHNSAAAMPCAKYDSHHSTTTWMKVESNDDGKSFVKCAPETDYPGQHRDDSRLISHTVWVAMLPSWQFYIEATNIRSAFVRFVIQVEFLASGEIGIYHI